MPMASKRQFKQCLVTLVFLNLFVYSNCLVDRFLPGRIASIPASASKTISIQRGGASVKDNNGLMMGLEKFFSKVPPQYKTAAVFASGLVVGATLYTPVSNTLKVYDTAPDIPAVMFKTQKKSITGVVASVTDGDTFRIRHKTAFSNGKYEGKLSEKTIVIRIAAVDTPETAKFGKEGQPFGEEAKQYAKEQLLGKEVTVQLLSRDQYQRVVGMVSYGRWPMKKNLSEELLKQGLAVIYRQGGAEYGGQLDVFEKLENQAKKEKRGIWSKSYETPAEFKARQKSAAQAPSS